MSTSDFARTDVRRKIHRSMIKLNADDTHPSMRMSVAKSIRAELTSVDMRPEEVGIAEDILTNYEQHGYPMPAKDISAQESSQNGPLADYKPISRI